MLGRYWIQFHLLSRFHFHFHFHFRLGHCNYCGNFLLQSVLNIFPLMKTLRHYYRSHFQQYYYCHLSVASTYAYQISMHTNIKYLIWISYIWFETDKLTDDRQDYFYSTKNRYSNYRFGRHYYSMTWSFIRKVS